MFSSLNVESARCARHGNRDAAARLARAAAQLEGGPEFAELGRLLAELPELEMAGVVAGVVPEDAPAALADALRAVARRTEEFREHELGPTGPVEVIAGTIAEVHEGYVLLVRFGGPAAVVPRWMAVAARRTEVGELLALVMDKLDEASAVVEALPAIDVGSGGDTFTPFGRTDARVRSMTAEDERLLTGEPEAPRVVLPITIER
ncbi:MAG TPA: hypothetical protein VHA75_05415 [Rugosimonospora sp.]|nr:hypothetical protein [Rugosimonospora sp.]